MDWAGLIQTVGTTFTEVYSGIVGNSNYNVGTPPYQPAPVQTSGGNDNTMLLMAGLVVIVLLARK